MNWRDNVRKVTPYTPGEQPKATDIIKLNTNENPYPPAPGVMNAIRDIEAGRLRKYPDPTCEVLVDAIARCYHIDTDRIFVGVGSDDVLAMAFLTFFNSDKPILFPNITYSFYDVWAGLFQIPYMQPELDEHLHIDKDDYVRDNGGIVIANPNAPTGVAMPIEDIEYIVKCNPESVVIIDEAYIDFGADSALHLIDKYDNLLIVRTTSKSRSLAGLRVGYAFGQEELIKALNDVKYSYNSYTMNYTSLILGAASFDDNNYFCDTCNRIIKTRQNTKQVLRDLGFELDDSMANFLWVTHPHNDAKMIFEELKKQGIYVRYFDKPIIDRYLRITIGTDEEMEKLCCILKSILR